MAKIMIVEDNVARAADARQELRGQPMAQILVVDDDARNLRLAAAALEHAGREGLRAEGGAEGVEAAVATKGDRERLIKEGFDGYLEKPIRYMTFLASVAALLAGEP